MATSPTNPVVTRRTVLRGAAGAATAGVAASTVDSVAAQSAGGPDYGGWFDNTSNFDGTIDKTGQQSVTVTVGAQGNNGNYAFDPAAIRVDPGTEIVWEWSGKGSMHNVVDEAGAFESEMTDEAGHTFTHTVEQTGIIKYACTPHKTMGMKGALVVGNPSGNGAATATAGDQASEPDYGDWFSDVSNYTQTADKTGQQEVTITVGADGNNGNYAFDPPAVRVGPGTRVIWEWSGKGSMHNVVAEDGSFESELTDEAGFTFEQTIESAGILKYACTPHKTMGMKGTLVVSEDQASTGSSSGSGIGDLLAIGGGLGLAGTLLAMFAFGVRSKTRKHQTKS
jgi:halocyanin-like protein